MDFLGLVKKGFTFRRTQGSTVPRTKSFASYEPLIERLDELEGLYVRDIMTPRSVIQGIDIDLRTDRMDQLLEDKPPHLLVYSGDLDNVLGWMTFKEVKEHIQSGHLTEEDCRDIGKVSENLSLKDLFLRFVAISHPVLLVLDSQGQTAGMVSLKSLLDSFFGFKIQSDDHISQ